MREEVKEMGVMTYQAIFWPLMMGILAAWWYVLQVMTVKDREG